MDRFDETTVPREHPRPMARRDIWRVPFEESDPAIQGMKPAELAQCLDHTLLQPEATPDLVDRHGDEAAEHGCYAVCVHPLYVRRAVARLATAKTIVASVVGFPLGADEPATVAEQARRAVGEGAREIDMMIWLGGLLCGDKSAVVASIYGVARAVHGAGSDRTLKVILETAALSDEQLILGCRCAVEGEADFVSTSTGFHPAGGATVRHVRLLRRHASPIKIKAAGGIGDFATAIALIDAGAHRLGTSGSVAILRQCHDAATPLGPRPESCTKRPSDLTHEPV